MRNYSLVLAACWSALAASAAAEERGVITDPDGYVNLRAGQNVNAAVIAKVKTGEPFTFECEEAAEWCKVRTKARKSGWMHRSRIRVHYTEKDLPQDDPDEEGESEIDECARGRGFDYTETARRAARGDTEALKKFFGLADAVDGAAAESHAEYMPMVYHILGDKRFAEFLSAQPIAYRIMVRNAVVDYAPLSPGMDYLGRHFPETIRTLFRREIVEWHSPDGRFAIRKVFSDELDLSGSKVTRAEVIDRESGEALCDITSGDIGTGDHREGEVSWSPDSKRFAYVSSDPSPVGNLFSKPQPDPKRKQTVLYELSGASCKRIDVVPEEPPDRAEDTELQGAFLGHKHTEPLRWVNPDMLVLQRHEYYEKLKARELEGMKFESMDSFDRLFEVTVNIGSDGKATANWRLLTDAERYPDAGGDGSMR